MATPLRTSCRRPGVWIGLCAHGAPGAADARLFRRRAIVIEVDQTLIEPKLEMGRPINDQYPYLPQDEYDQGNRYVSYPRPVGLEALVEQEG